RVKRFAIRPGSGGRGTMPGGNGVIREIEFLRPASLSVLTQHRTTRPYGQAGGGDGQPGVQWLERATGERIDLASIDAAEVENGDRFIIETPGGGGWGTPE